MLSRFLTYRSSSVHYLTFGTGDAVVIAFHGYAGNAASFACLHEEITPQFLLIAIDLPFHGHTLWNESRSITKEDMACIVDGILKDLNLSTHTFALMGYSMGGRLALAMAAHLPFRVSRLLLLAPDGLKTNFWYWLATQTKPGNRFFHFTMDHPKWLFRLLLVADRCKLVNRSIHTLVHQFIYDPEVRRLLYARWTCMQTFRPDLKQIRVMVQEMNIPVRILYGKHDRIIHRGAAARFIRGLTKYCEVYVIDAGHQLLQKKHASSITALLHA